MIRSARGDRPRPGAGQNYALAAAALEFHRAADTLTPGVRTAIDALREGAKVVLLAHQPIAFPYDGVTAQYPLMETFRTALVQDGDPAVNVHLVMDTDDAREAYFRTSRVPMPTASHGIQPTPLQVRVRHTIMAAAPRPSEAAVEAVLARVTNGDRQLLAFARSVGVRGGPERPGLELAEQISRGALQLADSLATFNSFLLSQITNVCAQLNVVFVPYTAVLRSFAPLVGELLRRVPDIRQMYGEALAADPSSNYRLPQGELFWLICEECGRRTPVPGPDRGHCPECSHDLPIGPPESLCAEGLLVPRVAIDDLIFQMALPVAVTVSYLSSAPHVLPAQQVLSRMGHVAPHVLWRPRPMRFSVAEAVALRLAGRDPTNTAAGRALTISMTGRGSLLYGLAEGSPTSTAEYWRQHWGSGAHLAEPCSFLNHDSLLQSDLIHRLEARARSLVATDSTS